MGRSISPAFLASAALCGAAMVPGLASALVLLQPGGLTLPSLVAVATRMVITGIPLFVVADGLVSPIRWARAFGVGACLYVIFLCLLVWVPADPVTVAGALP